VTLQPTEVRAPPLSPERFRDLLDPEAWAEFEQGLELARQLFEGRVVWNVNSTAQGGGVAEMLRSFTSYSRGAGLDMRWMAIEGTPAFFAVTKRLHNFLHGEPGDGGEIGPREREIYQAVTRENAEELAVTVRPEDVVILHDPQTAGLVSRLKRSGAAVVWRSHVGAEEPNELVHAAWEFLAPYVEAADACVFSRHAYVPDWAVAVRTMVIQPSIDAFSPKNQEMEAVTVRAILGHVGILGAGVPADVTPTFTRYDGSPGRVDRLCEVLSTGPPPPADVPLVIQVSRWDRLKDHRGVMLGFAEHALGATKAHLVLAGPNVSGVADDPEGAEVLDEVVEAWRALPHAQRARVHLCCLPMADVDENAAIVNALQRHSTIVAQKSIQEGFGLTVAEAMWKSTPVVASAVGGIKDQIVDGETGLFLKDPRDLREFGGIVRELLADPQRRERVGRNAREHVRNHFLANRHARQYIDLLGPVLAERGGFAASDPEPAGGGAVVR
jgi:trehalose synthase